MIFSSASFIVPRVYRVHRVLPVPRVSYSGNSLNSANSPLFRRRNRVILDQARDGFGRLGPDADPVLDAVVLKLHLGRVRHRVVGAEIFDISPVPLRTLFLNNKAVERLTL